MVLYSDLLLMSQLKLKKYPLLVVLGLLMELSNQDLALCQVSGLIT
jgi:hypothetical protein